MRWLHLVLWVALGLILAVALGVAAGSGGLDLFRELPRRVEALGARGPLAFGVGYAVAVMLMVPGSAMTLAAGALFGPVEGTLTVVAASNAGAWGAFLIARYLARGAVARWLGRDRRFEAVDRAVSKNGVLVVALLRLSPVVPFNVQNYLYGLTGIGFWTCGLTSAVAMLPGTVLYVVLGHAARAGLEAASGGPRARTPAEWAFLGVGVAATLTLSVVAASWAKRTLRTAVGEPVDPSEEA